MNELCSKEHIINLDDGFFLCGGGDRMFWAIVCGRRKLSRTICNFMQIGLRAQKYEAVDEHCTHAETGIGSFVSARSISLFYGRKGWGVGEMVGKFSVHMEIN